MVKKMRTKEYEEKDRGAARGTLHNFSDYSFPISFEILKMKFPVLKLIFFLLDFLPNNKL